MGKHVPPSNLSTLVFLIFYSNVQYEHFSLDDSRVQIGTLYTLRSELDPFGKSSSFGIMKGVEDGSYCGGLRGSFSSLHQQLHRVGVMCTPSVRELNFRVFSPSNSCSQSDVTNKLDTRLGVGLTKGKSPLPRKCIQTSIH